MFDPQIKIYLYDCFALDSITLCFCLKFVTTEKAGIFYDLWITSFVSASENLKRLGIQCYAECYLQVLWPEKTIMIIYFDLLQAMKYLLKFL